MDLFGKKAQRELRRLRYELELKRSEVISMHRQLHSMQMQHTEMLQRIAKAAFGDGWKDGYRSALAKQNTGLQEQIPRLIFLCHPDKHDNSKPAQLATQWLLEKRKQFR